MTRNGRAACSLVSMLISELAIYRLSARLPVAHEEWDGADFRGDVVVRARSIADARLVAAEGIGTSHRLNDEDLYSVKEVNYGEEFAAGGPRTVIAVF